MTATERMVLVHGKVGEELARSGNGLCEGSGALEMPVFSEKMLLPRRDVITQWGMQII